jgi:membrane-associated phospholipid phosphatase
LPAQRRQSGPLHGVVLELRYRTRPMVALLDGIHALDTAVSAFGESARSAPLTVLFLLASTWWVKWPLIAAVGAACDRPWRRLLPRAAVASLSAVAAAGLAVMILKETFDRARPPLADASIDAVGLLPASASFPSGHAATAFAAAVAVGIVHPRLRRPLLALAALVAVSRVYLGMHFLTDVVIGSLLGVAIGAVAGTVVRAVAPAPTAPMPSPDPLGTSSAPLRRSPASAPTRR